MNAELVDATDYLSIVKDAKTNGWMVYFDLHSERKYNREQADRELRDRIRRPDRSLQRNGRPTPPRGLRSSFTKPYSGPVSSGRDITDGG